MRTFALLLFTLAVASHVHRCRMSAPTGWYVNGVRPDGAFELRPVLGAPDRDLEDAHARRDIDDPRAFRGWIYCTGGATPRQDGLSVWCQR